MSDKIKVVGIKINCPSGELTLEEAQELYNQLDKLFGEKVKYIPSQPIIIERDRYPFPSPYYQPIWVKEETTTNPKWLSPDFICKSGESNFTAQLIGEFFKEPTHEEE